MLLLLHLLLRTEVGKVDIAKRVVLHLWPPLRTQVTLLRPPRFLLPIEGQHRERLTPLGGAIGRRPQQRADDPVLKFEVGLTDVRLKMLTVARHDRSNRRDDFQPAGGLGREAFHEPFFSEGRLHARGQLHGMAQCLLARWGGGAGCGQDVLGGGPSAFEPDRLALGLMTGQKMKGQQIEAVGIGGGLRFFQSGKKSSHGHRLPGG